MILRNLPGLSSAQEVSLLLSRHPSRPYQGEVYIVGQLPPMVVPGLPEGPASQWCLWVLFPTHLMTVSAPYLHAQRTCEIINDSKCLTIDIVSYLLLSGTSKPERTSAPSIKMDATSFNSSSASRSFSWSASEVSCSTRRRRPWIKGERGLISRFLAFKANSCKIPARFPFAPKTAEFPYAAIRLVQRTHHLLDISSISIRGSNNSTWTCHKTIRDDH